MGTLHEDQYTFFIISRSFLLRMRIVPGRSCIENKNIFCMQRHVFEDHAFREIMWENIIDPNTLQMKIWRVCISCWITKATNTQSEYVIFIILALQQLLHEHASMLSYV
jgi:hypothetical protein